MNSFNSSDRRFKPVAVVAIAAAVVAAVAAGVGIAIVRHQKIGQSEGPTDSPSEGPTNYLSDWLQLGSDIDGEAPDDSSGSGRSVSLSGDGSVVAIGASGNDGNGSNAGHVRVYQYDDQGGWTQRGSDIDGEAAGDLSGGSSVSLSRYGSTVAIGARYNSGNGYDAGHVRVYAYDQGSDSWEQLGSDIDGEDFNDQSGWSVSLSGNGHTVAIGAPFTFDNGNSAGHVRVYVYDDQGVWNQLGSDIDGEYAGDLSGASVSLSGDGSTVAIGARYNNRGRGVLEGGHVRVYGYEQGGWIQLGSDMDGEGPQDVSGGSVSLSDDGATVAIGAHHNSPNRNDGLAGHVRVYTYDQGVWKQLGSDIDGKEYREMLGQSVSLSDDGSIVAIGARYSGMSTPGLARVYEYDQGDWTQLGPDIVGEANGDYFGSVSLSGNGAIVAIGAPSNDGNGNNAGHVRVFEYV